MEISKSIIKNRNFFLLSLIFIAVGLSLSKPLASLGQICLLLTWVWGGDIKAKLTAFYQNKTAVLLSSLYCLSLIGLIYTNNFEYANGDIRRKIALLSLPLLISGFSPLTQKEIAFIFKVYVAGVLAASFWCIFVMLGGLNETIIDVRDLSRFNSHIRFGLEICLAIFGAVYYLKNETSLKSKLIWLGIAIWLIAFLFILSLFTGVVILFLSAIFVAFFYSITSKNIWFKYGFLFGALALIFTFSLSIKNSIEDYYANENVTQLELLDFSDSGERYQHDSTSVRRFDKENGHYIWRNIAWYEVHAEWKKRSKLSLQGLDLNGQNLSTTLFRFLTSKGLVKNAKAVQDLTDEEVKAIEQGISNYKYLSMNNIEKRLNKIIWEFDNYSMGRDYNSHSVIMRWVYWKTAYHIFKQNPFIGVGTGDVQDAFDKQYEIENSLLLPEYRLRAHNQYITYAVSFGIIGVVIFFVVLFYPFIKNRMYSDYLYLAFFSIILLSMLTEDTLETQIGATFFAFFNTIFLLKEKN